MVDGTTAAAPLAITCTVNGRTYSFAVDADTRLVALLRDELQLTGTKIGCEVGVCGACTVLVDGQPTSSCLTLAAQIDGRDVVTIEGIATSADGARLRAAFAAEGAFQCGFCTSGQIVSATALLADTDISQLDDDELAESLHGNVCRCTGYYGILRAIRAAAT